MTNEKRKLARHSDALPTEKSRRRELIYSAMEALYDEILDLESALVALELVYFGKPAAEPSAELAPAAEKEPRGSAPLKRKGPGKGRGRKHLSQTPAAKLARAYREKKKAEAGQAHSAHEVLKDHSQAGVIEEAAALDRPGNALIDRKERKARKLAARTEPQPAPDPNPDRKPTVPPVVNGSLTGLPQRDAIKAVLRRASRQLNSAEILDRLTVGGYHFNSENPKGALSVALASMRGELMTERRAGRLWFDPITGGELERGNQ